MTWQFLTYWSVHLEANYSRASCDFVIIKDSRNLGDRDLITKHYLFQSIISLEKQTSQFSFFSQESERAIIFMSRWNLIFYN